MVLLVYGFGFVNQLIVFTCNMLLNSLNGRELFDQIFRQNACYLVCANTDGLGHIFERVFCNKAVFTLTKQRTSRGIVMLGLQNAVNGRKIEVKLIGIVGLEFSRRLLNYNIATQIEVVEQ